MNRRYSGAVAGAVLGSLVGATIGGLVGRGIALFGDETVEAVVPMIFCAVLGYAIGGASGCKGSLERIGAKRATAGSIVAGVLLIFSVIAAAFFGSDTVVVFVVVLIAGLVLAGLAAAAIAGEGTPKTPAAVPDERAPRLEVTRQTVPAATPAPEPEPEMDVPVDEAPRPARRRAEPLRAVRTPEPPSDDDPAAPARPRRTRPLRAGDGSDDE